jgi:hypothetical protein
MRALALLDGDGATWAAELAKPALDFVHSMRKVGTRGGGGGGGVLCSAREMCPGRFTG